MTRSLFNNRQGFRPLWYPWALEAFKTSEQMHWLPREVPLGQDVIDWKRDLTPSEQHQLTQIFRFFTQADIDVASGYIDRYMPVFRAVEVRMMMASIAARESIHILAYSTLIDELGLPETEYQAFLDYVEMKDKHEFMFAPRPGLNGLAKDIAVFSAFGEGLQLFSSFVILLNFTRRGLMKGMGQIVSWSIRDETHHVDSMMKVYHTLLEEHPEIDQVEINEEIIDICRAMVQLEDRFIDLAYLLGDVEGLTADEVKQYIRYIADRRLEQLDIEPAYGVETNPLPWVDGIVFGPEHANFFEVRASDYAKGSIEGSWETAFD